MIRLQRNEHGFAWLLVAMGVAQTERHQARTIIAFVAMFVLVLIYREWS